MKNETSDLWSLNNREKIKGFALTLIGAFVALIWTGLDPVITEFTTNKVINFAPFLEAVNWGTVLNTALVTGGSYFGFTFGSGSLKKV